MPRSRGTAIRVPSLREHREDVPELANLMLSRLIEAKEVPQRAVLDRGAQRAAQSRLARQSRPAPERRAHAGADGARRADHAGRRRARAAAADRGAASRRTTCRSTCRCATRATRSSASISSTTSRKEGGNISRVAESVGLERTHLYRKLKQLGIKLSRAGSENTASGRRKFGRDGARLSQRLHTSRLPARLGIPPATRMSSRLELANAIRALAMDAVQKANSGHPGMPMGMAEIAEVLWNGHLRHNPANPQWPDRDRFVLSNGHGSMLLYALLHLTGYDLPMEELKRFRQLHSKTPGHPEHGLTPGVETTTGPLGQGLANAVGMALAERVLAAEFNRRRARHRRSPHLRVRRRRLPDGRHLARGVLARRHAGARQADRVLGRQRHLHRFGESAMIKQLVHRRHAAPFRSLRLERDPGRGRP